MKLAVRKGFGFGLTSGVISTLGLMMGLSSGTHSSDVVLGGIIVIAIADAMSDAVAIHMSEETNANEKESTIWPETIATFASKFIIALIFILPIIFLQLTTAVYLNIAFGLLFITLLSYYIAKFEKRDITKMIVSHLAITIIVVVITSFIGQWADTIKTGQ